MAGLYAGVRMCCIARMLPTLATLFDDLRHITIETQVGSIAPDTAAPCALRTELDALNGSLEHTRQATYLVGPVAAIHAADWALSQSVRRQWPRLLQRFAHLDAQADALTDDPTDDPAEDPADDLDREAP